MSAPFGVCVLCWASWDPVLSSDHVPEVLKCPNSVCAGVELVVRPKTHSRESNRGMLTLAEEEGSRRNASSPVQSPCHSLPSGRPHRRESEPVGPQRAVRGLFSRSEETWSLWRILVDRWGNVVPYSSSCASACQPTFNFRGNPAQFSTKSANSILLLYLVPSNSFSTCEECITVSNLCLYISGGLQMWSKNSSG